MQTSTLHIKVKPELADSLKKQFFCIFSAFENLIKRIKHVKLKFA